MKRLYILFAMIVAFSLNAQALFEVKDASDHSVFEITDDGIRIFNYPDTLMIISSAEIRANLNNSKDKALSRSFSISTTTTAKAGLANVLEVTTDQTIMREGIAGDQYTNFSPENIFIGLKSGMSTIPAGETSGQNNIFLGNESGITNTSGASNVFIGYKTGNSNLTGYKNCFVGQESGYKNYDGHNNVFMGYRSGYNNYDGGYNVFIGYNAGNQNISGSRNVFIGYESGIANTTGWGNTFVGEASGVANKYGYGNSAFGNNAAFSTTDGAYNTSMGYTTGGSITTGNYNSSFGAESGRANRTGSANSVFGFEAGRGVFGYSHSNNSFFGYRSGYSTSTGSNNTYYGYQSGYSNVTGTGNVFIGYQAGYSETGSDKLYIDNTNSTQPLIYGDFDGDWVKINGDFSVLSNSDLTSVIVDQSLRVDGTSDLNGGLDVIGNATFNGTRTSVIHPLGNTTNGLFIQSTYNSNTDSWHFYQSTGDDLNLFYNASLRGTWNLTTGVYTSTSDKKLKKNIEDFTNIMDRVMQLQPKKYNFKSQSDSEIKYIGLIAQDVKELFPSFVNYSEEDDTYTMDYAGLSVIAIQAIKELKDENDKLNSRLNEIEDLLKKLK